MRIETIEQYRERMIEAFHNADCDSLISVVALPTEKEFQHLEWLLKKEYVPFLERANKALKAQKLPEPVRHGKWIKEDEMKNLGGDDRVQTHMYYTVYRCSSCQSIGSTDYKYCPYCGADMREEI